MLHKYDTSIEKCELKFDSREGILEGYASVFGGVDSYGDTIVKGAFAETLENRKSGVLMLHSHMPSRVLGKWLDLKEDDRGLFGVAEFTPGNTDAQNVYASVKHQAITGLSIGFKPTSQEKTEDGRILKGIDLVEISVVAMPADDAARISVVKSEIQSLESFADCEAILRESGAFSRAMAKAFIGQVKSLVQCESELAGDEIKAISERLARKAQFDRVSDVLDQFKFK